MTKQNEMPDVIYIDHLDLTKINELAGWWDCCPDSGIGYIRKDKYDALVFEVKDAMELLDKTGLAHWILDQALKGLENE